MCRASTWDTFLFCVAVWSTIQLTWTIILLIAQSVQILRQMTTLEVSNLGRYGFMGGKGGSSMATQSNFMAQRAASLGAVGSLNAIAGGADADGLDGDAAAPSQGSSTQNKGHRHRHGVKAMICGAGNCLLSIVGLDLYTRGKAGEGLKRASSAGNPFDKGFAANCMDFWTKGKELGVNYEELYEVPVAGFQRARRNPYVGEGSGMGHNRRWSMWAGIRQGLGIRRGANSSRTGYEAVANQA
jgi:palmitoyltransferase ZDHHC13/17